jgi:hypothetical protein
MQKVGFFLESCYFLLTFRSAQFKGGEKCVFSLFFVKLLKKIKKPIWACHRLFSDFASVKFRPNKSLIVRK